MVRQTTFQVNGISASVYPFEAHSLFSSWTGRSDPSHTSKQCTDGGKLTLHADGVLYERGVLTVDFIPLNLSSGRFRAWVDGHAVGEGAYCHGCEKVLANLKPPSASTPAPP